MATGSLRRASSDVERIRPGEAEKNVAFQAHLAIHRFGHRWLRGRQRILDIGCGEGYGALALSERSRLCVALDRDYATVKSARQKYSREGLRFLSANACTLPFRDHSFEALWSVEVIEHLYNARSFLAETKRVLVPQGILFLSTPNRPVFSRRGRANEYHVREYDVEELRELLETYFRSVRIWGVYLTNFLYPRHQFLAEAMFALQWAGADRWLPVGFADRLYRRAFRRKLDVPNGWDERNRRRHWRIAPLGVIGPEHCLDLVAVCRG